MQLELSLSVADRLHEALLVRGEPLDALDAVRMLLASADVPLPLCREILATLVVHDRRFHLNLNGGAGLLSLRRWEIADPDLASVPFVALDLETTGARPGAGKITEVGAVRIEGLKEVGRFGTLVNPLRPIPPMITQITGITQAMVAGAPRIDEIIPELLEFIEGAVIVAHNAPFDVGFLNYELQRLKGRKLGEGAIDTLPLARTLAPGLPNYRLHTVAEALGAPVAACHRALADAQAAGHVFVTLAGRLQERGITRLGEVRAFSSPASRSALEKLSLTRDLPRRPGTYRFLDGEGQTLYVGKADRLGERVRSHFIANGAHTRHMRSAVKLVERIDWDETVTPLEAVVQEQRLILRDRPTCNLHGVRPETYAYLKAGGDRGLNLVVSCRAPRWLTDPPNDAQTGRHPLLIGPFRKRSRLHAALDLLHRCYPIRRCPRNPDSRPCIRAEMNHCLAPCATDPLVRRDHDALVTGIMGWIAGLTSPDLSDPLERAEETIRTLSRKHRYEEAQKLHEASEHLSSVRRSYQVLVEAHGLCFAALWRQDDHDGRTAVRLNLVWGGRLLQPSTLHRDAAEQEVEALLGQLWPDWVTASKNGGAAYVAVPQTELDSLLAVRRWFCEEECTPKLVISPNELDPAGLERAKAWIVTQAGALLASEPPAVTRRGPAY